MFRGGTAELSLDSAWTNYTDVSGTPTYTVIDQAVDVTFDFDGGSADVSSRISNNQLTVESLKSAKISFGYRPQKGASETMADTLSTKFTTDAPIRVMITDGAASSPNGWGGINRIASISESQPNADGAMITYNLESTPGFDGSTPPALIDMARV